MTAHLLYSFILLLSLNCWWIAFNKKKRNSR